MAQSDDIYQVWLPVIGKALAQLCLHHVHKGETIAEKAFFLEALGLGRQDVANMLGTSYASVTELLRLAKNKKGGKSRGKRRKAR